MSDKHKLKNVWHDALKESPPDIPEDEDFGVEYEIMYRLPNGELVMTIVEWLWEKQWNCKYPVVKWREYNPVIEFPNK